MRTLQDERELATRLNPEYQIELYKVEMLRRLRRLGGFDVPLRRFVGNNAPAKMPAVRLLETERRIVMRRDGKECFVSIGENR